MLAFINRPNGDFTFNGQLHRQRRRRFPARVPDAVSAQATGDPNHGRLGVAYRCYVQDEFRLSSRLTLNAGLRYELAQPFVEKDDELNAFHPGQQSTRFPQAPAGLVYPGDPGVPRGTYETDKNNFAPRAGRRLGPARRRPHQRARRVGDLLRHARRARATSSRTARWRRRSSRCPRSNYPLDSTTSTLRQSAGRQRRRRRISAGADLHRLGDGVRDARTSQHFNVPCSSRSANASASRSATSARAARTCRSSWRSTRTLRPVLRPRRAARGCSRRSRWCGRPSPRRESWYDSLQASLRMRPWHGINFLASYTLGPRHGSRVRPEHRRRDRGRCCRSTIGDEASIDARARAREGRRALRRAPPLRRQLRRRAADARATTVRSAGAFARRLAAERHRPDADRVPADGRSSRVDIALSR